MVRLISSAFQAHGKIPERYTCEGANVSPPVMWRDLPEGTESVVLILDDPDAPNGPFTHWIVYDIPPLRNELSEGFSPASDESGEIREGRNDFGEARYDGPCPPSMGDAHHYHFRLYALDASLGLPPGANRSQVFDLMHDHVLGQTELVVVFGRGPSL